MKLVGLLVVVSAIACGGSNKTSEPAKAAPETAPATTSEAAPADTAPVAAAVETPAGPTGPATTNVKGCAATSMTAKSKPAHSESAESLSVAADGSTIVTTHVLGHACCLKGEVNAEADGTSVIIHEKLSGKACKCRCGSTIETRQPVSAGTYDVRVVVEGPGETSRDAGTNQVTVH